MTLNLYDGHGKVITGILNGCISIKKIILKMIYVSVVNGNHGKFSSILIE